MRFTHRGRVSRNEIGSVLFAAAVCLIASSCSGVPSGQVQGVLVLEDGQTLPSGSVDVFLAAVHDSSDQIELNTSWQSPVDAAGAFLIEDVPSGSYCIVLFNKSNAAFSVVLEGEEPYTFDLPPDEGIDLRRVDASRGRSLGG
jgi:hypothetical protein